MQARLLPLYFKSSKDAEFTAQVERLRDLFREEAEILEPVPLGAQRPEADAVVFPQLLGDAYRQLPKFKALDLPIFVITSEFGTMSMWDWEIISYLESERIPMIALYSLDQAKKVCKALALKNDLKHTTFLVFQDNPGEGAQAEALHSSEA